MVLAINQCPPQKLGFGTYRLDHRMPQIHFHCPMLAACPHNRTDRRAGTPRTTASKACPDSVSGQSGPSANFLPRLSVVHTTYAAQGLLIPTPLVTAQIRSHSSVMPFPTVSGDEDGRFL